MGGAARNRRKMKSCGLDEKKTAKAVRESNLASAQIR